MSDIDTVTRMLYQVECYGLSGSEFVSEFTREQLAGDFNGIGPECFPAKLRRAIDNLNPDLLPCAFVHDVRWSHSDGTREWFDASNAEFRRNGYRIARAKFAWYRPMRYLLMNKARIFGNLCQTFGWPAYEIAYTKNKTKGTQK